MTQFELSDDYRTVAYEAVDMLGLNQEIISSASDYHELYDNLSPAKRQLALAAVEVYRLFTYRAKREIIHSSQDVNDCIRPYLQNLYHEEAWAIFLNTNSRIIKIIRISSGGLNMTAVDVRVVLKEALLANAVSFALVHNHPSGNTRPSSEDDKLTEVLSKAGKTMNIKLVDHLIFTNEKYYSYSDEGRL